MGVFSNNKNQLLEKIHLSPCSPIFPVQSQNFDSELKDCKISISSITITTTLPRPSDISALKTSVQNQLNNTDTNYYFNYEVDNINLSGSSSEKLTIDTSQGLVRLYVKSNITMSGSANMEHTDTGKPERFALGDNFEMQVPDSFGSLLTNIYGNDYNLGFKSYSTSAPTGWQRKEIQ